MRTIVNISATLIVLLAATACSTAPRYDSNTYYVPYSVYSNTARPYGMTPAEIIAVGPRAAATGASTMAWAIALE